MTLASTLLTKFYYEYIDRGEALFYSIISYMINNKQQRHLQKVVG